MELMDLYDADRHPTGQSIERDAPVPPGNYILVVQVCIFNEQGQMLIQKRQDHKSVWGGLWDLSAGGAVDNGEHSRDAAMREVREELGLSIDLSGRSPDITTRLEDAFGDIYLVNTEPELSKLTLQPEEVSQVQWASEEQILMLLKNGHFVPFHPSFISFLFFRSKHTGNLTTDK